MGGMTFEIESELLEQAARQAVEQRQLSNPNNLESYETAIAHQGPYQPIQNAEVQTIPEVPS